MAIEVLHREIDVDINTIQLDETNPNEMTDLQFQGLKQSFQQFGFVEPIIIDQDGIIADGEHRYLAWKSLGNLSIKAIRLQMTTAERKLLRQSMNKLRGQHEIRKDVDDLKNLIDNYDNNLVAVLIGQTPESLDYLIAQMERGNKAMEEGMMTDGENQRIATKDKTYDMVCPFCKAEFNIEDGQQERQL